MSLLVIGTVAFDAIETPFGKTDRIIGGAATYIGLSASYFTKNINLVSVVGDDFPQSGMDMMSKRGINLDGLEIRKGEKSFFWSGRYHNDMNSRDTLVTELNVLETFNPQLPSGYQNPDFVMLGNLAPAIQRQVIEQLKNRPKLIVMDTMNFWMNTTPNELAKALKLTDVLIINDEEARQLSGEYALAKAAKVIMKKGPRILVIKKGEHGALLFQGDEVFFAPALPLEEVFDPTGAGDVFAGGFMGYLSSSNNRSFTNMKRAVVYGSAMASFCVEKFGPQRLTEIRKDHIQKRVGQFVDLAKFRI